MIQQIDSPRTAHMDCGTIVNRTPVNVADLQRGQSGIVASLQGNPQDVASLAELGLRRGTVVHVIRRGSTSIIKFNSQRLCLRLGSDVSLLVFPQN